MENQLFPQAEVSFRQEKAPYSDYTVQNLYTQLVRKCHHH